MALSSLAIFVVMIEVAMCRYLIRDDALQNRRRNPLLGALEYRRDPLPLGFGKPPPYHFSEAASTNGQYRCIDRCEIKEIRRNGFEECTVEFNSITWDTKVEPCTVGGKVDTESEHYFDVVYSSMGQRCKDECKAKGGFNYPWCIIDLKLENWSYKYSRCVPKGLSTSHGLKCIGNGDASVDGYNWRGDCGYHCDCEDATDSCGHCGEFKSAKWCAVVKDFHSRSSGQEGVDWDFC